MPAKVIKINAMNTYINQIKRLTDDQLIILDLVINIYPIRDIQENINRENIPFDFGYYDYDNLNKIKLLVKTHIKLRNIDIL